eukprot:GHVR01020818.1.p1 GENE.GHVR01020818.1~~GHVR01020818.1.p1  ORF type:complete len:324 (+),score=40.12 GHVR01020818.1:138-1109(+)
MFHSLIVEINLVKQLIDRRTRRCDKDGSTYLGDTSRRDVVEFLLDAGAVEKLAPLFLALKCRHLDAVSVLLDNVDVKDKGTALIWACVNGKLDVVKLVIAHGADINHEDKDGDTSLMRASRYGREDVARLLIERGADINLQNKEGCTALGFCDQSEVAKLLIENGADVNHKDKYGKTPLMTGSESDFHDVLLLFIEHGADVNCRSEDRRTALMHACMEGNDEVVSLLIENGADINHRDENGNTPIMIAVEKGYPDIVKEIFKEEDRINSKRGIVLTRSQTKSQYSARAKLVNKSKLAKEIREEEETPFEFDSDWDSRIELDSD